MTTTTALLTEDDWERLRDLRLTALRTDPDAFGSSLAREEGFREMHWRMRLRGSPWWVDVDDGADVGLVCVIEEPGAPPGERHVVSLWVAPGHRRRGVGVRLLDAAAAWSAAQGATSLTVWVTDGNGPADALYERAGFAPTGVVTPLPRDPSRTETQWARPVGTATP